MSKMTRKGQVTIPKRLRDHFNLKPGSEIEFVSNGQGEVVVRTKEKPNPSRFDEFLGTVDLGMTTDEFMKMIRGDPDE